MTVLLSLLLISCRPHVQTAERSDRSFWGALAKMDQPSGGAGRPCSRAPASAGGAAAAAAAWTAAMKDDGWRDSARCSKGARRTAATARSIGKGAHAASAAWR